jgi:hypothetical protein
MRPPKLRILRASRRLACGHTGQRGDTVVSKRGHGWLCGACQRWVPLRSVEDILAEYRNRTD